MGADLDLVLLVGADLVVLGLADFAVVGADFFAETDLFRVAAAEELLVLSAFGVSSFFFSLFFWSFSSSYTVIRCCWQNFSRFSTCYFCSLMALWLYTSFCLSSSFPQPFAAWIKIFSPSLPVLLNSRTKML